MKIANSRWPQVSILLLLLLLTACMGTELGPKIDMHPYYYPFEKASEPIIYKYSVSTSTNWGLTFVEEAMFLRFKKEANGTMLLESYDDTLGRKMHHHFIADSFGVSMLKPIIFEGDLKSEGQVTESQVILWHWPINKLIKNGFEYESSKDNFLIEWDASMLGLKEVENSFGTSEGIELELTSRVHGEGLNTGEKWQFKCEGTLIDLKGIGYYSSNVSNAFGYRENTELVQILTEAEWQALNEANQ